jgi:hypothetical protein
MTITFFLISDGCVSLLGLFYISSLVLSGFVMVSNGISIPPNDSHSFFVVSIDGCDCLSYLMKDSRWEYVYGIA